MARWATHRTDNSSKALIAYAESLGFVYENIGGTLDGLLAWGERIVAVDWKSKGGTLTPKQANMGGDDHRHIGRESESHVLAIPRIGVSLDDGSPAYVIRN